MKHIQALELPEGVSFCFAGGVATLEFDSERHGNAWRDAMTIYTESLHPMRPGVTPAGRRLAPLLERLGPGWFAILCALYDAHQQEPNPIIPIAELAERTGLGEDTVRGWVRLWRRNQITPAETDRVLRHFLLEIRRGPPTGRGGTPPYQFFLRELDDALGTWEPRNFVAPTRRRTRGRRPALSSGRGRAAAPVPEPSRGHTGSAD